MGVWILFQGVGESPKPGGRLPAEQAGLRPMRIQY